LITNAKMPVSYGNLIIVSRSCTAEHLVLSWQDNSRENNCFSVFDIIILAGSVDKTTREGFFRW